MMTINVIPFILVVIVPLIGISYGAGRVGFKNLWGYSDDELEDYSDNTSNH